MQALLAKAKLARHLRLAEVVLNLAEADAAEVWSFLIILLARSFFESKFPETEA